MTTPDAQSYEYEPTTQITRVRALAAQGWRMFATRAVANQLWFVMERRPSADLTAERDAALSQAAEAARCLSVLRRGVETLASGAAMVGGQAMDNALLADRDRLAEEVAGLRRDLAAAEAKVESLTEIRDQLQGLRAEERAERDRLAKQVWDLRRLTDVIEEVEGGDGWEAIVVDLRGILGGAS